MKKLKLFMIYSYVTLVFYVGSENFLYIAKAISKKGNKKDLKFESLWKTTFKRFKEGLELINKSY